MAQQDGMKVIFHGVRGSYPVPGESTLRSGGNTTCHEVVAGPHRVILDAGTGIINVGNGMVREHLDSGNPMLATLLFSHVHHDHTYGFLYFKPAYFKTTRMMICGPKTYVGDIEDTLKTLLCDPFHPVQLDEMGMDYDTMNLFGGEVLRIGADGDKPTLVDDETEAGPDDAIIRVCSNWRHTKIGVMHFRVEYHGKSYVFATDTEGTYEGDPTLIDFARDADLLAHDAQYTEEEYTGGHPPRKGWGHSTYAMACAVAQKANVKQLALIHHEPERDDAGLDEIESKAKAIFPGAFLAREGMTIEL